MNNDLLDIRHAIQTFLEEKLEATVEGAGMTIGNDPVADIEVHIDNKKYLITMEELWTLGHLIV